MNEQKTAMAAALTPHLQTMRERNIRVEPVSRALLSLPDTGGCAAFERARDVILKHVRRRAGETLPECALRGESFATGDTGLRPVKVVSIDTPKYWALRLDGSAAEAEGRASIIEAVLAKDGEDDAARLEILLQRVMNEEDERVFRTPPRLVGEVVEACGATLDGLPVETDPWLVDCEDDVEELETLLRSPDRTADVIVVSLPDGSEDPDDGLISSGMLAKDLAGLAHIVVISGPASYLLTERVGREYSAYRQAVRTYRPGFYPEEQPWHLHPLGLADRIRNWNGGPKGYAAFIKSEILRRTVEEADAQEKLPTFSEVVRLDMKRQREAAEADPGKRGDGARDGLAGDADEIAELREQLEAIESRCASLQKKNSKIRKDRDEYRELLDESERERKQLEADNAKMSSSIQTLRGRMRFLEAESGISAEEEIPADLSGFEEWADQALAGTVHVHPRALREIKQSDYEDIPLIYNSLLLLRDYYAPMRQKGGRELLQKYEERRDALYLKEEKSISKTREGEQGEAYTVTVGKRKIRMNFHFKKGTSHESRYCFRLYFDWDKGTGQVVVGWMPSHLPTRAS